MRHNKRIGSLNRLCTGIKVSSPRAKARRAASLKWKVRPSSPARYNLSTFWKPRCNHATNKRIPTDSDINWNATTFSRRLLIAAVGSSYWSYQLSIKRSTLLGVFCGFWGQNSVLSFFYATLLLSLRNSMSITMKQRGPPSTPPVISMKSSCLSHLYIKVCLVRLVRFDLFLARK